MSTSRLLLYSQIYIYIFVYTYLYHLHLYPYINIHIQVYICIYIYVYISVYIYIDVYLYIYIPIQICVYVSIQPIQICVYVSIHLEYIYVSILSPLHTHTPLFVFCTGPCNMGLGASSGVGKDGRRRLSASVPRRGGHMRFVDLRQEECIYRY